MEFEEKDDQGLDLIVLLENCLREARRLWLLGLVLVLVGASAFALRSRMHYTPVYQADATFTVKVADPLYASVSTYNMKTAEQMAKTFPYILTSGVLESRVKEELGISGMGAVSVSVMPNSSVITLKVRDSDPQRAYDVLNAVIRFYPEIAEFVVGSTVLSLLDESGMPTVPSNAPNLKRTLLLGCMLGGGIWCVLILLLALSKTTIHNEDMLREMLNIASCGQIPEVRVPAKDSCPLVHTGRSKPEFSESIRALRLRVERAMGPEGKKVLLVSSAIPGEGKTTVSLNLGLAMANLGKKVLVIDCDLRNPSVAKGMKMTGKYALSDYLEKKATVRKIICSTDVENLFVIPGGSGMREVSQPLNRERTALLLQEVRTLFDFVILDTPPCSVLADAGEVAELADAGLLVVRQDFASRDQILDGVQRLTDADLDLIGWVFNFTHRSLSGYNGYGSYGYGSYGYGKTTD